MSNQPDLNKIPNGIEVKGKIFHMGGKVWVVFSLSQTETTSTNEVSQQNETIPQVEIHPQKEEQTQTNSSSQTQTTNNEPHGQKETTRKQTRFNKSLKKKHYSYRTKKA